MTSESMEEMRKLSAKWDVRGRITLALVGMVTPSLRAVYYRIVGKVIECDMLYATDITDEEIEIASEVHTELLADYDPKFEVQVTPRTWTEDLFVPEYSANSHFCAFRVRSAQDL